MRQTRLTGLKMFGAGLSATASRDVVYSLASDGADVTAVGDEADADQLQRDLGLYGLNIKAAPVNLGSVSEVRLFAASLQGLRQLPHIIVCCCGGGDHRPRPVSTTESMD
jgi:NAD(P)-dependent dehydrogenase (short-subunit alcohol dehydrogenase family)